MKLLVGLGNPGQKYARNRHNIGAMALDQISKTHEAAPWRKRFSGQITEGRLGAHKFLLLKPETFMNLSGDAVGKAARFFKIPLNDIIVFHDELDLKAGKLRLKNGGGTAGHKGLKSVSAHIGNDYFRVRIGIGHPGQKDLVHRYVLQDFSSADQSWVEPLLAALSVSLPFLLEGNNDRYMTDVARQIGPQQELQKKLKSPPEPAPSGRLPDVSPGKSPENTTDQDGPLAHILKKIFHPIKTKRDKDGI